jgi:hypothetical protein
VGLTRPLKTERKLRELSGGFRSFLYVRWTLICNVYQAYDVDDQNGKKRKIGMHKNRSNSNPARVFPSLNLFYSGSSVFRKTKNSRLFRRLFSGGDKRDRTADLLNAIQALSQLSYTPKNLLRVSVLPQRKIYITRRNGICQQKNQKNFPLLSGVPVGGKARSGREIQRQAGPLFLVQGHRKRRSTDVLRRFMGLVILFAVLASGLGLLAALDAGALVVLTLTNLGQHTRLGTAALETLQSALQRLVFSDTDFRHLYFPPSGAAGRPLLRKGHLYGFNRTIIFEIKSNVKFFFGRKI